VSDPRALVPMKPVALFLHPNPDNISGQEKCLLHYAEGMATAFRPVVLLPREGRFAVLARERGFEVRLLPRPHRLTDVASGIAYVARLVRLMRSIGARFVFCSGLYSSLYGSLAGRLLRLPVATYVPTEVYNPWDISRSTLVNPSVFICVSNVVRDLLIRNGVSPRKCIVIYPDVVEPGFTPSPEGRAAARLRFSIPADVLVVGYIGQVIPRKNVEVLVRAAARVSARRPETVFLFCGEDFEGLGRYREQLKGLADELGVAHSLFPGFLLDPSPAYLASDVAVFPSLVEGLSRTTVESLYFGVAPIVSDIPPHREVVTDGVNGLVFEGSSEERLAERILELLASPERREAFSRAGRETFARRFSSEAFRARWAETWQALVRP
jgi:glycosyltransferase involved in cell wall biosynthesis